ncbi:phage tail assembly chaperone [Beijerinckia sp. L45]|uniref:phage tail assembly chaperone n=1 Tax=Beijerinckia sp. L45 TaxID=1641855 RepID=UPI00131AA7DB|nr:hypothetical protein [Beijerinckia sp. L45]
MANFQIAGISYQSRVMDGETQTLVLKRLLPTFAALMGCQTSLKAAAALASVEPGGDDEVVDPLAAQRDALMPVARELASVSDADVKFVLNACLAVTKREVSTGVGWVDVVQRGQIQDQSDATFIGRLTIAWHVLGENFADMLKSLGVDLSDLSGVIPK